MAVMLKKRRSNRTQWRRSDYKSPCGDGWAWESIAFFTFYWKSPQYPHGTKLSQLFDLSGKPIFADKGYDSRKSVHRVEERGGLVVIPNRVNARCPRETDLHTYKERHLIEKLFLKLKTHRRFSTRYEKKACYFHAVVSIACSLVWLL